MAIGVEVPPYFTHRSVVADVVKMSLEAVYQPVLGLTHILDPTSLACGVRPHCLFDSFITD